MPRALVLRDCLVHDGSGAPPQAAEIWIVGEHVVAPGSAPPGDVQALGGCIVAPGLIDAHVHLCFDGSPDPAEAFRVARPDQVLALMIENARRTLVAGVTTVRDLGAPTGPVLMLREGIAAGRFEGPTLLVSGAPMTTPGGHLACLGGAVRGADEARAAVGRLAGAGVDVVKVMVTGGGMTPGTDPRKCQFTDEEMLAIAEAAQRGHRPVACHTHTDAGILQGLAAGARTIEHGSFASSETLAAMARAGVGFVPTLAPALAVLERSPYDEGRMAQIRERWQARRAAVRLADAAGVRVIAGSDAGVALTPHGGAAAEVRALAEAGMVVEQALAAVWQAAAAALDLPEAGTLAPGSFADLVVLLGDPREDLRYLSSPLRVMRKGKWITA